VHTTVSTAPGICSTATATCRYCGRVGTTVTVRQIPGAVDTVVCAPDDGWRYHLKHVQQFPDKINCVMLHLVRYILKYERHC